MISNNIILLNMFVLVLLQQFELFSNPLNPEFLINRYLNKFRKKYIEFISDNKIACINERNLIPFLRTLNCSIGFKIIIKLLFMLTGLRKDDKFVDILGKLKYFEFSM